MNYIDLDSFQYQNSSVNLAISRLKLAAQAGLNLIIEGASGTGKSTHALFFHNRFQTQKEIRFLHAATLTSMVLQNEFKNANVGTIAIRQIESLPLSLQNDLHALMKAEPQVRVVAMSAHSLQMLVKKNLFQASLYALLNGMTLQLISLKDRQEDMAELVDFMLDVFRILYGSKNKYLSDRAFEHILDHSWPGNIRELETVLERAFLNSQAEAIQVGDLDLRKTPSESYKKVEALAFSLAGMSLSEVEKRLILQTLELTANNKTKAANLLGISIRTLRNKLNEYKLSEAYL